MLKWCNISHIFIFNLFMSLCLKRISCRQHISGLPVLFTLIAFITELEWVGYIHFTWILIRSAVSLLFCCLLSLSHLLFVSLFFFFCLLLDYRIFFMIAFYLLWWSSFGLVIALEFTVNICNQRVTSNDIIPLHI